MHVNKKKSIYFASDFHLGIPNHEKSIQREREICSWLDCIKNDALKIFFIGDVFDFWFEYKHSIPKGNVRIQAKMAELVDLGIEVHVFQGNHDMWMFNYLSSELGVVIHENELIFDYMNKSFYLAHGDGLGPGDRGYKFIKRIFRNKVSQWFFKRLHPNFGIGMANYFSRKSRGEYNLEDYKFKNWKEESIYQFICEREKNEHSDLYILGHRHLPLHVEIKNSVYINLGEWLHYNSFAKFNGSTIELLQWRNGKIEELKSQHEI
jgi:UDP-2,3-diacylglucosamine hydrolase